jgi:DNA-binding winged helix-turn-helix (wHTH) protein/tetratricopeptide (TPR) repeat protein
MPSAASTLATYRFGEFELDLALYELRRRGRRVPIEPKALDLLAHLIDHRHRVVSKDELVAALWPREVVTEASLTYCVSSARQALGDDGSRQGIIATVRRRGYRFVAALSAAERVSPATAPAAATPTTTGAAARSFFVGREPVMATLHGALENALAGRGRIALLVGEPGIGKTRTAEELAAAAATRGALVLFGRCYEAAGAPAYWPWMQVVRGYLAGREPEIALAAMQSGAADLAQLVPETRRWLSDPPADPAGDASETRFRLFDSASAFLRRAAQTQPVVIVLDDLHWADPASLLLLQFVARELGAARLLVLGTYRDVRRSAAHPLGRCLSELTRLETCQCLELQGLASTDIARFIEATTGIPPASALVERVAEQTGGNPFFMTEYVRLLSATAARYSAADAVALAVPTTVREAVARHVQLLSRAGQALLPVAAVFGREFDLPALAHACARDARRPAQVLDGIDDAVAARLIEPVPGLPARYRFVHALVRETLYDALSSRERTRLHARAGAALAAVHAEHLDPHLSALAHHYAQAAVTGDPRAAIDYAMRAGRRAAASWAYEEAAAQFGRALHLHDRAAPQRTARGRATVPRDVLLLELGENLWKAGDVTRAKETFQQAAAFASTQRSPAQFARAALGFGGGFRGFDLGVIEPLLIDLLEDALRMLPRRPSPLRGRVMARLAVALYHVSDSLERREHLSRDAVDIAERSGDPTTHLAALYSRHWAIWGPDNLSDRLEAARTMIELAERVGDRELALHGRRFHLIDSLERGDLAAVDTDLAVCADLAAALRQPYYLWYVEYLRAMRTLLEGRIAEAERLAERARAIGRRAESSNVEHLYGGQLLWIRREQGRLSELEPIMRGLAEQYPTLPSWRCGHAYVLSQIGRLEEARAQLDLVAARRFADLPRNAFWLVAVSRTADTCATLADVPRAQLLSDLLAPYQDRVVEASTGAACLGSVHHPLGRLAATLQHWSEAESHFGAAIDCNQRLGAPHLTAHVQRDFGEMLLARGDVRSIERAQDLLGAAATIYRQLDMEYFAAQTAMSFERARQARRPGPQKAASRIRLVR